jgi:hypothetical protein
MNADRLGRGGFEERLLAELRGLVAAQPSSPGRGRRSPGAWLAAPPRRRPALLGGAAVLAAGAAVAGVALLSGGASAAYAVSTNDDGTVTVEISSLADAAGLQRELGEAGVRAVVQYLPPGKACKDSWFTQAESPGGPGSPGGEPPTKGGVQHTPDGSTRFTISRHLSADQTLVIMTQTSAGPGVPAGAEGPSSIGVALAKGQVGSCEVVDAPAGSGPLGLPSPPGGGLHTERGTLSRGPATEGPITIDGPSAGAVASP